MTEARSKRRVLPLIFIVKSFTYIVFIKTQNKKPNVIQKTSPQNNETQMKIIPYSGLA